MEKKSVLFCLLSLAVFGMMIPVFADLVTIPQGGTVFIGEEGLDITDTGAGVNSQLVWFGPKGTITSVPAATFTVGNPTDFYASAADFSGKTGPWFLEPSRSLAFYIQDPVLDLKVMDVSSDFIISPTVTWIPTGDVVGFRIETNLGEMSRRDGGAPITIRLSGPGGVVYSSVGSYSLEDISVGHSPFETGGVWITGSSEYARGNYTAWAECNANRMMDNYPVVGKTKSSPVKFLMQSVNPLITKTPTPTATMPPATFPTTAITTTVATPSGIPTTPVAQPTTIPATTPIATTPSPTVSPGFGILLSLSAAAVVLILAGSRRR
ncbi:MAG: DUF3821 domain-containing protein [Methanolinea sp.]|nr:DUF3821 domain-containing protein [Methanolinea sp.]